MKMENISETVLICMVTIAAIQFVIIFAIIKSCSKKSNSEYADNKKSLIKLLTVSPDNTGTNIEKCC
jgi:hypothetical protein